MHTKKATVLIIEDSPTWCQRIRQLVSEMNHGTTYAPIAATTLAEADALIRTAPPDIIVSDMMLPDATVSEVIGWLSCRDCPVVVVTASNDPEVFDIPDKHGFAVLFKSQTILAEQVKLAILWARQQQCFAEEQRIATRLGAAACHA